LLLFVWDEVAPVEKLLSCVIKAVMDFRPRQDRLGSLPSLLPYLSVSSPLKKGILMKLFLSTTMTSSGKKGVCLEIQSWRAVLKLLNDGIDILRKPFIVEVCFRIIFLQTTL
jgi:hypothetical protein